MYQQPPLADLQFYGSYSRLKPDGKKESFEELCDRVLYAPESGLFAIGQFTPEEQQLIEVELREKRAFGSARFLWCGGTDWLKRPENWYGVFNCTSRNLKEIHDFGILMSLGMQGCGTGAVLEEKYINLLPPIKTRIDLEIFGEPGDDVPYPHTALLDLEINKKTLLVGDSREGWVSAYQYLINLAVWSDTPAISVSDTPAISVIVDIQGIRPTGTPIKGFGGTANPSQLAAMFKRVAEVLNGAVGRRLTSVECCLLIDEPASCIQAGGVRRFAGIKQGSSSDREFATAKLNLWSQDSQGNWRIDEKRQALKASNHTRIFHYKPTLEECTESVRLQWQSGEGAIMWAGEAIARANADLLNKDKAKKTFLNLYPDESAKEFIAGLYWLKNDQPISRKELEHRMSRTGLNPCGEKISSDGICNLATVSLANIDPLDNEQQEKSFKAAALQAAALLQKGFDEERFKYSREIDPIIIVSCTQMFDFFVRKFGLEWLNWWECDRDMGYDRGFRDAWYFQYQEQLVLARWKRIVHETVWEYCDRHNLKRPNRCTGLKPEGSLTLLTGIGCCGVHPPKSWRYIRRKEFRKDDPVALAAIDYGYNVMPLNSDKDDQGNLLNDPWHPNCTGWVVEVPVEEPLVQAYPGIEEYDPSKFSAKAQFDWFMQVQRYYSAHNCFSRDTKFLTDKGVRSFEDFSEGDSVIVLNKEGEWTEAKIVKTKEVRNLLSVKIKEGKTGKEQTIKCTECHRFPVKRISGGSSKISIKKAVELKIGHRLILNVPDDLNPDEEGIRHGIAFGDGSLYRNNKGKEYVGCQLYLCNGKRDLRLYFSNYPRIYEREEINQTRIYGLPTHYKSLPSEGCSQSYLAGFLAGLLASDGNISNSVVSLSTIKKDVVNFLETQCPRLGIRITNSRWFRSGANAYTKKTGEECGGFQIVFSKATFPVNLILRSPHLDHFLKSESQPCQWKVIEVTKLDKPEIAWCVVEPKTHHFTLENNILVMNTSTTLELRESEINEVGKLVHDAIANNDGYVSMAMLARHDDNQVFPRMPFEPITKQQYEEAIAGVLSRRKSNDFSELLNRHLKGVESGPNDGACDAIGCQI